MSVEKTIISVLTALIIAQAFKIITNYNLTKKIDLKVIFENGGMPSSHTASTTALATSIFINTGLSYYFVIAGLLAIIVMNDAVKVRLEVGEEARILNILMEKEDIIHRKLAEIVGHTPTQIMAGFFLGIITAIIIQAV